MDLTDLHPQDDYSHRFFIWHEWIKANGPLTPENVFDYFASSMFYDKQSNNQVLRMQTMHTGMPISNEAEELKRFTGVEFAVVHAEPPSLFIIHKRERISPEDTRPLQAYFIVNDRIYQSPDMYTVLSNRLLTSLYSLKSSLDVLRKYKPDYTPRTGFAWPIVETERAGETSKKTDDPASLLDADPELMKKLEKEKALTHPKKQQNMVLLLNAMRTTAVHPFQTFHDKEAATVAPSEAVSSEEQRSSATPAPALISSQSAVSQSSGPAASQDSAKGMAGSMKRKKKRASVATPTPA
ncbi:MED6 mediator sub complex component-domain-containing protein [Lactarius indigo]|nr:MED6 mediator sub complex component-domain-containing protein [Lactarius indigo]